MDGQVRYSATIANNLCELIGAIAAQRRLFGE
jgi:hypothetical protein